MSKKIICNIGKWLSIGGVIAGCYLMVKGSVALANACYTLSVYFIVSSCSWNNQRQKKGNK